MQLVPVPERPEDGLNEIERAAIGKDAPAEVRRFLAACPAHAATPLAALPGLAARLGIAGLHMKDEGQRFGLLSFKALGGAYAVARLVEGLAAQALGRTVAPNEMQSDEVRGVASKLTVACATDGNHGRSVAAGARLFGCRCVIFLHPGVSQTRADAIASFGAEIVRTTGSYDDSVAEATKTAGREGWTVVSDTSWDGYHEIPARVMQGYTVMVDEVLEQLSQPPSHVFLQGGVGGLAAAVAGHLLDRLGAARPCIIVVEPARANCLQESARQGRLTAIPHGEATVMSMLECFEPSQIAWRILERTVDFFVDVDEGAAIEAMKTLAYPQDGDPELVIGESGAAGLAGLAGICSDPALRAQTSLDEHATVLLIGTEGATDGAVYQKLVGKAP